MFPLFQATPSFDEHENDDNQDPEAETIHESFDNASGVPKLDDDQGQDSTNPLLTSNDTDKVHENDDPSSGTSSTAGTNNFNNDTNPNTALDDDRDRRPVCALSDRVIDALITLLRWGQRLTEMKRENPDANLHKFYTREMIPKLNSVLCAWEDELDLYVTCPPAEMPPIPVMDRFLTYIKSADSGYLELDSFSPNHINTNLIDILPPNITAAFLPLNVSLNNMNFYNSFGLAFFGTEESGNVFRRAVTYHALQNSDLFNDLCEKLEENSQEVLNSLRHPGFTNDVEIALLSNLVDRNITVFDFDKSGNIVDDVYYDFGKTKEEDTKKQTIFFGHLNTKDGNFYFPLIRKTHRLVEPLVATKSAIWKKKPMFCSKDQPIVEVIDDQNENEKPRNHSNIPTTEGTEANVQINGLVNINNSCFINATMQSILCLPFVQKDDLPEYLKLYYSAIHDSFDQHGEQVMLTTKALFELKRTIKQLNINGEQEDSHAMLKFILFQDSNVNFRNKFFFEMKHELRCTSSSCDEVRTHYKEVGEVFLPPNVNPEKTLANMQTCKEIVSCLCQKCNATTMFSSYEIVESPLYLLLVTQFGQNLDSEKGKISYPQQIKVTTEKGNAEYKLSSLVTHVGINVTSGHFRSFLKKTNGWICCDDDKITFSDSLQLDDLEMAYMKIYVKTVE